MESLGYYSEIIIIEEASTEDTPAIMSKRGGGTCGTGVLTLAERCHYIISEIPVMWKQGKKSNVGRRDIIFMGSGILKLA